MKMEGEMSTDTVDEDENIFYFESDHLPLRGNREYSHVLRTIAILEVQRMRVHKQLEDLELAKKRYLEDPELLLQKLKNKEPLVENYTKIEIPDVPNYDTSSVDHIKIKEEPDIDSKEGLMAHIKSKSENTERFWTNEEQRRLEQLLIKFPTEEFESRRFAKIAKALGNRTPQQVSSRVQKYFQKLQDAGLPIPGRKPKNRRAGRTKTKNFFRPSTFFPAYNVPVHMPEDEFQMGDLSSVNSPAPPETTAHSSDAASVDYTEEQTPEERRRMLQILKAIRDKKKNHPDGYNPDPLAPKCDVCDMLPVSRIRWRCNTCYCYVNQCDDCTISQLVAHKFEHISHDVMEESET